jgi:hypothetical protein
MRIVNFHCEANPSDAIFGWRSRADPVARPAGWVFQHLRE